MDRPSSDCAQTFGHKDFDLRCLETGYPFICPVIGCSTQPTTIEFGKRTIVACLVHGIQLRRSETFVYWNGAGQERRARLRNFLIRPRLAETIALGSKAKAESHRLGFEMSEDALTWNVFVGLAQVGALRAATRFLTGVDPNAEPPLYLWGELVDVFGETTQRFAPLDTVRQKLEKGIRRFFTEPDIMLVVDGQCLVCVEAKFGSGNPMAHDVETPPDEKPKNRFGLIRRYLHQSGERTRRGIDEDSIGSRLHSQLFRNLIFAAEMAGEDNWHVVNLVSDTQWRAAKDSLDYSHRDPTGDVRAFLSAENRHRFTFRTWEELYRDVIAPVPELQTVRSYLQGKSAPFRQAFDLAAVS